MAHSPITCERDFSQGPYGADAELYHQQEYRAFAEGERLKFIAKCEEGMAALSARGIRARVTKSKSFPKLVVDPAHSGMVYLIHDNMGHVKIGVTRNLEQRLAGLQTAHPIALGVLRVLAGGRAVERWLHEYYAERRMLGEWFHYCSTMREIVPPIGGGDWPEGGLPL